LTGNILKDIGQGQGKVELPITITFLQSGTARVTIDEKKRQTGDIILRHDSKARKERYNEAASWAIVGGLNTYEGATMSKGSNNGVTKIVYGPNGNFEAVIKHSPFGVTFKRDGVVQVAFNDRGLLNYEHWRAKVEKPVVEKKEGEEAAVEPVGPDESTWWEESFGGHTDSKPRGPESIAMDISFPGYSHVYGIAEHTGPLSLKETRGGDGNYDEPYRLYNSDVFEYEVNSPMTLYGNIPFMQAHKQNSTVGVFWLNAAETWVDITKSTSIANPLSMGVPSMTTTNTHWISESGLLDVFVFLGPRSQDVLSAYAELTGHSQLPNDFAIAYHQCRWNYVTDADVKDVDRKFDRSSIPFDIIWLDIEYTNGKKYFTWDPDNFPDPVSMQDQLAAHKRKLVAIIDPHIKKEDNYHVDQEMASHGYAVKNKDGNAYEGWCWPGSSHWIDAFSKNARNWWSDLFNYDKFPFSRPNMFIWNDMNEPSVFNGPETTMPKDNLHEGGWEHRDVHNLNGMTFHNATYHALLARNKEEEKKGGVRPFVLTRSFFAGSQRLGAMWTGDNLASWDHLASAFPMILGMGISGYPFAGADVGGFFGNPSKELLVRWYQNGIFNPFFRAHAHIDTRRREPYLLPDYEKSIVTQAIRLRYSLLPSWYTAFHQASLDGSPIVKPMFYVHPSDAESFAIDDQLYVGSTGLLVKPVVTEGANSVDVYLPDTTPYFDYFDYTMHKGPGYNSLSVPFDKIALLMRAGHIFPRRDRPRRSSGLMKKDPLTLVVVLPDQGNAEGTIYLDDGESFDFQQGAYIRRKFLYTAETSSLSSEDIGTHGKKTDEYSKTMKDVRVEKVVVVNAPSTWSTVNDVSIEGTGKNVKDKAQLIYHSAQNGKASWAVVRDPGVAIGTDWKISFV